jgi:hypothetical protein
VEGAMTLLTDAEWRQAVDAFCEHIRALPLDDAWLENIRVHAGKVCAAIGGASGDLYTQETFAAVLIEAYDAAFATEEGESQFVPASRPWTGAEPSPKENLNVDDE